MGDHLTIRVAEDGADAARLDALTGHLRQELQGLDGAGMVRPSGDAPPANARGIDVAAAGALLVTLSGAATSINDIVTVLRAWSTRGGPPRTVRIEMDGDVLELSGASTAQQDELVDLFVRRHGRR
jgi:hypothetical protein